MRKNRKALRRAPAFVQFIIACLKAFIRKSRARVKARRQRVAVHVDVLHLRQMRLKINLTGLGGLMQIIVITYPP